MKKILMVVAAALCPALALAQSDIWAHTVSIGAQYPGYPLYIGKATGVPHVGGTHILARIEQTESNRGVMLGYDTSGQTGFISPGGGFSSLSFWTHGTHDWVWAERMRLASDGKLGIGTTDPQSLVHLRGNQNGNVEMQVQNLSTGTVAAAGVRFVNGTDAATGTTFAIHACGQSATGCTGGPGTVQLTGMRNAPMVISTNQAERVRIDAAGNVGIGVTSPQHKLQVAGSAHFSGTVTGSTISAHFQDVAEWVPSTEELPAGTVVVVTKGYVNTVTASSKAYDTTVAGVVSAQPGVSLGVAAPGKVQVATTGRVKVRVDATRGAIEVGDLLVTSGVAGTAMRSVPLTIDGTPLHRPGTILGKALEPLSRGTGEILVLLSLQ